MNLMMTINFKEIPGPVQDVPFHNFILDSPSCGTPTDLWALSLLCIHNGLHCTALWSHSCGSDQSDILYSQFLAIWTLHTFTTLWSTLWHNVSTLLKNATFRWTTLWSDSTQRSMLRSLTPTVPCTFPVTLPCQATKQKKLKFPVEVTLLVRPTSTLNKDKVPSPTLTHSPARGCRVLLWALLSTLLVPSRAAGTDLQRRHRAGPPTPWVSPVACTPQQTPSADIGPRREKWGSDEESVPDVKGSKHRVGCTCSQC